MLTSKLIRTFGRLIKPKLSKYPNIQGVLRDKTSELEYINQFNSQLLSQNRNYTIVNQIKSQFGVNQQTAQQMIKGATVYQIAHDTLTHKGYWVKENIGSKNGPVVDDLTSDICIPYSPDKSYLKFHPSINADVLRQDDLPINKNTAYIFNLPPDITEKQIVMEIGFRSVKNVTIKYCMLGLPAYAVAEFESQNSVTDKIMTQELEMKIKDRLCPLVTYIDNEKLLLSSRQIVLHDIDPSLTQANLLQHYSQFGRILSIEYPQNIYREPSLKQIKEIYKKSKYPIHIKYHRKNQTIEEEFYPQYVPSSQQLTQREKAIEQNEWRLNFIEEIDVHEGQQHKIKIKGKGFCIITYACMQQAQNCYLRERLKRKCELSLGKDAFHFDEQHRKQILRYIDHRYIQKKKQLGIHKKKDDFDNQIFQDFYLDLILKNATEEFYENPAQHMASYNDEMNQFIDYHNYQDILLGLKKSIGSQSNQMNDENTIYGKSFGELAEEQLYQHKLHKQNAEDRYQINIGNYYLDEQKAKQIQNKENYKKLEENNERVEQQLQVLSSQDQEIFETQFESNIDDYERQLNLPKAEQFVKNQGAFDDEGDLSLNEQTDQLKINNPRRPNWPLFTPFKNIPQKNQQSTTQVQDEDDYEGKRNFSTAAYSHYLRQNYRKKTLEEKVKSHIRYNKFVRDIINEYMGVFSTDKLEQQFYRKKPTYINPQNLKLKSGSSFLPESTSEIKKILQFTSNVNEECQHFLNLLIKQNEKFKSLNLDVQEHFLKNLNHNEARSLMMMNQFGIVNQQFDVGSQEDAEQLVKQLNLEEAEFGQEFKLIEDQETNQKNIIKIAKLETILPLELVEQSQQVMKKQGGQLDIEKIKVIDKYIHELKDGKEIPQELCKALNVEPGSIFNLQQICNGMRQNFKAIGYEISNKNLQKLINLPNYTEEQIGKDYHRQKIMKEYREKFDPVKASDYSKDPSNIYAKDKSGKFRVSKFRQI